MKERSFQSDFGHYLKTNAALLGSAAFELKSSRTSSLPFSDVKDHQVAALWHAKHKHIYFKIPDVGFQNPWDCFLLNQANAYVVIRYASGEWYMIDIDDFIKERDTSARKSLTEERAKVICTRSRIGNSKDTLASQE